MTGALAAPSLGPSAGVQGFQFAWNAVASGNGATEFINNRGAGGGGFGWYDRVDTSGGAGSALMLLNSTGLSVGTITIGLGGKKLSKITLSTSAPGVLADGELYLRY